MNFASASLQKHPNDVDCKRIEKLLSGRARYKYVNPIVVQDVQAYVVRSPCCSRTVDSHGGEIDIARIEYQQEGLWKLYRMDDAVRCWCMHSEYGNLSALMTLLVFDPNREFWR